MSMNSFRGAVEWALMVALVFGAGAVAQAQDGQDGGPVIQIGKGDGKETFEAPRFPPRPADTDGAIVTEPGTPDQPLASGYWIGLVGEPIGPNHPLRAHVDIPEKQGVLVTSVVSDGPAARAGLKVNDILLRAGDLDLRAMQDLVELVRTAGAKKGQIALEVLRHGQRETVYVTPEARPALPPRPAGGGFGGAFAPGGIGLPEELLDGLSEIPFEFRNFGPGVIVGRGGVANLPNGVTLSIVKEDGQPARVTVTRGEEKWEIVGDDPASLEQLPEELRPFVEQMLHGRALQGMQLRGSGRLLPELGEGRLRERLERMEQRMEELQKRLGTPGTAPADEPREPNIKTN